METLCDLICVIMCYLQSLALPLYDVDIKLELGDHLPPLVPPGAQVRQLPRVHLDL